MKYTDRELRMFNTFSLLLLLIGGTALAFGLLEFAIMPEVEYYSTVKTKADPAIEHYSIEAVTNAGSSFVNSGDEGNALEDEALPEGDNYVSVEEGQPAEEVGVLPVKKPLTFVYETVRSKESNLGAMSRVLTGVVFMVLSVALNSVISHVKRHGCADTIRGEKRLRVKG